MMVSLALVAGTNVRASELDPVVNAPAGVIVRENADGVKAVYKAELGTFVQNAEQAQDANREFVKSANRINDVANGTELDNTSSNESWCYWTSYSPTYYYRSYSPYYYTYNYYGYSNYYYPSYRYTYSGYTYTYYYRNSCSHYSTYHRYYW